MREIIVAILLFTVFYASAQDEIITTYNYNQITAMYEYRGYDSDEGTNGFELGYVHGFNMGKAPLFFQTGLKLAMGFYSYSEEFLRVKYKENTTILSVSVPLDVSYKLVLDQSRSFAFIPYAGFNLRLNCMAENRVSEIEDGLKVTETENMFEDDYGCRRFQIGWHIGAGFQVKKIYVGADFGTEFVKFSPEGNCNPTLHIGAGYCF